jgi:hypothetical protein
VQICAGFSFIHLPDLQRMLEEEPDRHITFHGEVAEWSIATVLKTVGGASPPGVRIPPSPPILLFKVLKLLYKFTSEKDGPKTAPQKKIFCVHESSQTLSRAFFN